MTEPGRDVEAVRSTVRDAINAAGAEPVLLGWDAVGIQAFVTASSRPITMLGASETLKRFDDERRQVDSTIFAGGGRGLAVVPRSQVDGFSAQLVKTFRAATHGGQLAVAAVPFATEAQRQSLAWLRQRLLSAKDEAPAPDLPLPDSPEAQCWDCRVRPATRALPNPKDQDKRVCERCFELIATGRSARRADDMEAWSLGDVGADPGGQGARRIAVLSADGNDMGRLFASLQTLEQLAWVSTRVTTLFAAARRAVLEVVGERVVAPVTGGDDIRIFMHPGRLFAAVEVLARTVEHLGSEAAAEANGFLPSVAIDRLQGLGLGVGAVVADSHHPASRLLEMAHSLELSAKTACRENRLRSALDIAVLTGGEEIPAAGARARRQESDVRPLPVGGPRWSALRRELETLSEVPSSQRARVYVLQKPNDPEFVNWFRYQVARSDRWKAWCVAADIDWRDPEALAVRWPDRGRLELARLMETGA